MRAILVILACLATFPSASADEHGEPGPDEHVHLVAELELAGERYYILEDHGATYVYRETNGVLVGGVDGSGVQPDAFCFDGENVRYVFPDEPCLEGDRFGADERVTNGALLDFVMDEAQGAYETVEHLVGHDE
jgi:hypothetical protein